jgi:hypothetical protein
MLPDLSITTQSVLRSSYGIVLLGSVLWNLLQGRRFFLSERWGGYGQKSLAVDAIQNPVCYPIVMAVWILSAVGITFGCCGIWSALINLLLCRYYFISMRWRGVLRGMGAPGFITYWIGAAVFLLEYTLLYAPGLRRLALLVIQVDWALIMLIAGIYKFTAGYPRNEGMEFGLANPEWGTWWELYARTRPSHWIFWFMNQLAWLTEISAALLMLIPGTRWIGGLVISVSFLLVGSQVRLNQLTPLLVLTGLFYVSPGSPLEPVVRGPWPVASEKDLPFFPLTTDHWPLTTASSLTTDHWPLATFLLGYLILLPFAYAGMCYNFFGRRRLASWLQRTLEIYTNFFGMILWRVFSVNLVSFFIRIYVQAPDGKRTLVSRYGWGGPARFNHVGESIAITTIFTTLKYYPNNPALFEERLLRYARTFACPADALVVFEYVCIRKTSARFEFVPAAEYVVDPRSGKISERLLTEDAPVRSAHAASSVHEATRPGSYAPVSE